jgi:hypothetical protein
VGDVFFFALTAALYPALLAATTVMLLAERPKRMLLGYLLGALLTSITLGLIIVFAFEGSNSPTDTAQHTLSPVADIAIGVLLLAVAGVLRSGFLARRGERRRARRAEKKGEGPPRWQRTLNAGSARIAFVVGAVLSLPGASYLAGLHSIAQHDLSTAATVAAVVVFNLVMLVLLEIPLVAYTVAPDWTPGAVERFKAWVRRVGPRAAVIGSATIGALSVIRGVVGLIV